jgi:protein-disulfide isomerase
MLFRVLVVLIVLAGSYGLYELWRVHSFYTSVQTSSAPYVTKNADTGTITIVDFTHYECGACRMTSKLLVEQAAQDPSLKLVVRPVPFEGEGVERSVKMTLAAGLQGKFWEFHDAIINYASPTDEAFFKETAKLYDIDYEKLVRDAEGPEVYKTLQENANAGYALGIKTSPTIMVEKTLYPLEGPLTLPDILRMIRSQKSGS